MGFYMAGGPGCRVSPSRRPSPPCRMGSWVNISLSNRITWVPDCPLDLLDHNPEVRGTLGAWARVS